MAEKTSTAVSLRANRPYVQSLRALAEKKGVTVADLVRDALDAQLGEELKSFVIFFANSGNDDSQSTIANSIGPGAA